MKKTIDATTNETMGHESAVAVGTAYYVTVGGPAECFMGDLSKDATWLPSSTGYSSAFSPCCGSTDYFTAPGVSVNGATAYVSAVGSLSLSGVPDAAFANATATSATVASIAAALQASAASAGCTTCTVAVNKVVNADTGATLFTATARRLAVALTITYTVTGTSSASVAAVTTAPSSAFSTAVSASVATIPGFGGVTAAVVAAASSASETPSRLALALGVGLGGLGGLAIVGLAIFCHMKKTPASKLAGSTVGIARV